LEAARREEAAAKLQLVLEERIVYLTKEHEVQLAAVHEKHSGMLARVAASQEEAHAAALREHAVQHARYVLGRSYRLDVFHQPREPLP
jgi:hypothetical protein